MRRFAFLCVLACVGSLPAWAQKSPDLMQTPECLAARKDLDAALAAGGPRTRLDAARELAALKCFGARPKTAASAPEGRFLPPPASAQPPPPPAPVPEPAPLQLRPAPALPSVAPAPPPVAIPRNPAVTSCDTAGCWDSNGNRYNQQGPMLLGPRGGVCTIQGGLMNCP